MSWSITPEVKNVKAADAMALIDGIHAPQSVKDYIDAGIDGLVACHGEDVLVTVTGYGHVCEGPGSYDVTTATITVRRADLG